MVIALNNGNLQDTVLLYFYYLLADDPKRCWNSASTFGFPHNIIYWLSFTYDT